MKYTRLLVFAAAGVLFTACPVLQSPVLDETAVDYYSKEVEFSRYIDPDQYYLEPVVTYMYNESGALEGRYIDRYQPYEGTEDWLLYRTDVFRVNDEGDMRLSEYYRYEYIPDTYTLFDEDDQPYDVTDYLLSRGMVYNPDDFLENYYEVEYGPYYNPDSGSYDTDDLPNQPNLYTEIVDYAYAAGGNDYRVTGRQSSTYKRVYEDTIGGEPYAVYDYVTEKVFTTDSGEFGDAALDLSVEFASWYDAAGYWTHELYHSMRTSEEGGEEVYYYTKYDWNDAGQVYAQQDFVYDPATVPTINDGSYADGSFDDDPAAGMDAYELEFAHIGALKEALTLNYDDTGNVVTRVVSYNGTEQERVEYRYNGNGEEVSMVRYVRGQSYPDERVETRYRDEFRNDEYNRIREEYTYRSYGEDQARFATRAANGAARATAGAVHPPEAQPIRRIRSNHER